MTRSRHHRRRFLLWDRRDSQLRPKQRLEKAKALRALSLTRRRRLGSLTEAFKQQRLDPSQALNKTTAVMTKHGQLVPKARDRIPRTMKIYERGRLTHLEIANSEVASAIGRYWDAIADLTETGKTTSLRKLRRQRFRDIKGRIHRLEMNPKVILELETRKPKPEMFEIYKR